MPTPQQKVFKLGIDLLQPEVGDPPLLTRLGTDEMLLAQVIATLLEGQFEKYNIDANQIYQSFDGLIFAKAHEAFDKLTEKAKFCVTPIMSEYGYIRSSYGKFLI